MKILCLFFILTLVLVFNLSATEKIPGDLIIWLEDFCRDENIQLFENNYSEFSLARERELSPRFNIWLFNYDFTSIKDENILSQLRKDSRVKEVQFNHKVEPRQTFPNDQHFSQQWALHNTGQSGGLVGADIDAPGAWEHTTGIGANNEREVVVAVIDSGFALNHPDISWWVNHNEIPGNGQDDDNNGYIDDYYGWNAYNNSGNLPVTNHGTHVSGIIGALGNNLIGVSGVGWDIKVMPIAGSSSNEAVVVAAYNYALEMRIIYNETEGNSGAFVVATNSSFGVNYGNPVNFPIWGAMYDLMGEAGILSTAATMNINADVDIVGDVPTSFPSPYLISVTNTTRNDLKNNSAAYGSESIELGAPGTSIYSTTSNLGYGNLTGTSMAAPHVAGVIGLMYTAFDEDTLSSFDSYSELPLLVKDLLLSAVDPISSLENITVTGGRLNAHQAVLNVLDLLGDLTMPTEGSYTFFEENVILNWLHDNIEEIDGFNIYLNDNFIAFTQNPEYEYTNLEFSTAYDFFITAISGNNESDPYFLQVPATQYGDVNRDGEVTPLDASQILSYFVGYDPISELDPSPWSDLTFTIADVDGNGYIQPLDGAYILQYYTGIIDEFPVINQRNEAYYRPEVELFSDSDFIYIYSKGELYGLGIEFFTDSNLTLSEPIVLNHNFYHAYNQDNGNYSVALITAEPDLTGQIIMKIPIENASNSSLTYKITVNQYQEVRELTLLNTEPDFPKIVPEFISLTVFPNPFNPSTTVNFTLTEKSQITLSIFNSKGQLVKTIYEGKLAEGNHLKVWQGRDTFNNNVSSGIYFVKLSTGEKSLSQKILLLK